MSQAYEISRQIFEDNAAEEGDDVTVNSLNLHALHLMGYTIEGITSVVAMQNALNRWQIRNFGVSSDERMALGFYGELDELLEDDTTDEARIDAWADMAIFCGQLLMNNRMSIAPVFFGHIPFSRRIKRPPSLSHLVLKHAQGIRGIDNYRERLFDTVHQLLYASSRMLRPSTPSELVGAYIITGAEVLKRDWRKFPLNGRDQ